MAGNPHGGHRQRVYDRLESEGLGSFANHEVLELILFFAIPRQDVNPLAHNLIDRFGSLPGVLEAPREELLKVDGMTRRSALLVSMMLPVFGLYANRRAREQTVLDTTAKVVEYARAQFAAHRREVFMLLCLDNKCRLIRRHEFTGGTPNEVMVHPRSLVEAALLDSAVSVVFMHNHPAGVSEPSGEDRQYTRKLAAALRTLGIELLDHVVVSDEGCYSFQKQGDMDQIRRDLALKGQ